MNLSKEIVAFSNGNTKFYEQFMDYHLHNRRGQGRHHIYGARACSRIWTTFLPQGTPHHSAAFTAARSSFVYVSSFSLTYWSMWRL